jgi:hypothetical protein
LNSAKHASAVVAAAIAVSVFAAPVLAKKPVAADEAAVRNIVTTLYAGYKKPFPDASADVEVEEAPARRMGTNEEGYEMPYSVSLDALINRWLPYGSGDELITMNSFDWWCQCQDYDPKNAKLTSQKYVARGVNRIDVATRFSSTGEKGSPLTFHFLRENGNWVLDDATLEGELKLRKALLDDIKDAAKVAKASGN